MGVPTDVHHASKQTLARLWSVAFHNHPNTPDGIIYPSRLNGQANLAIYSRAISKLKVHRLRKLMAAPELDQVLNDLAVELEAVMDLWVGNDQAVGHECPQAVPL